MNSAGQIQATCARNFVTFLQKPGNWYKLCSAQRMKSIFLTIALAGSALGADAQTKKMQIRAGLPATINHAVGSNTVQVLIPGVETIELDLSQPVAATYQIKMADYNFDGQKDFAFVAVNQTSGTQVYDIFLYRPEDKSFEALDVPGGVCERFGNVRLAAGEKTLRSSCRSGLKSSTDIFKWTSPFSLELVRSTDNSTEAQQEAAELKSEKKAEKADVRKEVREDKQERKKERKEEREDDDE